MCLEFNRARNEGEAKEEEEQKERVEVSLPGE